LVSPINRNLLNENKLRQLQGNGGGGIRTQNVPKQNRYKIVTILQQIATRSL
jgi:hypothetical protein